MVDNAKVKELKVKVKNLERIKPDVFLLTLVSPYLAKNSLPGQFVHLYVKPAILRRPFSVHSVSNNKVHVLFKLKGKGTKALSRCKKGDTLNVIGPLGKGFDYKGEAEQKNILLAGGIGVAPLVFLARRIHKPVVLLGFKTKSEVLCDKEFKKIGCKVHIATEDGSRGEKGTVIKLLKKVLTTKKNEKISIFTCGPKAMFWEINKLISKNPNIECQVSFEQFMGCGLGTCCSCTIETREGYKKVCKDGPVFNIKDIW